MKWNALLLMFLLLSSLAVTSGTIVIGIAGSRAIRFDHGRVADVLPPPPPSNQTIDDESGGG